MTHPAQVHAIAALTLQYPPSPHTMHTSPQRPVIAIRTHALQPTPSSPPDLPPSALSDASAGSPPSPSPTESDSASPQASSYNSPSLPESHASPDGSHFHVGCTTTENSPTEPRKHHPPPALPTLLPDAIIHGSTDTGPESLLTQRRAYCTSEVRASTRTLAPNKSSSESSLTSASSSSSNATSSPTSPAPIPAAHAPHSTPYLHPHAQSYAALASASANSAAIRISQSAAGLPAENSADQRKREVPPSFGVNKPPVAPKRRKMWVHALEKSLFTPEEIASLNAPVRRGIYTASLEAHIDKLHNQLLEIRLFPVPFQKLEPYRGLNSKTAKSMVSGLHRDLSAMRARLAAIQREAELRALEEQRELERNARALSDIRASGVVSSSTCNGLERNHDAPQRDLAPSNVDPRPRRGYVYPSFDSISSGKPMPDIIS